jgi:hypothetical protein
MSVPTQFESTFEKKYQEFVADMGETFPELAAEVSLAGAMPVAAAMKAYAETVAVHHTAAPDHSKCPGTVLPGVTITPELWVAVGVTTKRAVYDYISILNLCVMHSTELPGMSKEWVDNIMKNWRSRMDTIDFDSLTEKFKTLFGSEGGALPKLPEKFLKGKLAKLAEDIVREFKPEDFGLRPEDLEAVERDPTRAFEILMQASTSNPQLLQNAMMRVGKKLRERIQTGQLRPEDIASEAEELMKEFQSNPAFVEMMESFKSAFSFEDPAMARAAGRDEQGRLAQVKNRLRAKLEKKKAAAAAAAKK